MPIFSSVTNISHRKSFYTLALILLTILFLHFLYVAFYHCPRGHYGYKGERKKKNQTGSPTGGFPTVYSNRSYIHGRFRKYTYKKVKYPSHPPPFGPKTWELTRKEKEERVLRERRERPLSTPLETTSTDAMDTEEAQEFSKEIAEVVIEKELKKQKYEQYQWAKQTFKYQVPKSITIPVPDLNKPRPEKADRPTSVLSNFDLPVYEELGDPKEEQRKGRSRSMTPGLMGIKHGEGAIPKDPSRGKPTFQDYTSKMMSALNNPWKPRSKKTATPT